MSNKLFLSLRQQSFLPKNLLLCLCVVVICSGCASKEVDPLALAPKDAGYDVSDDVKLTATQEKIFYSTGELDRNIPKKGMPAVAKQYSHFLNKGGRITMSKFSQRAEDYLGHAREVFRKRGMPEELAFLAIVESGYNVSIKSHAGAAGAWQFMPYTGMSYGLHQDWWIDERLDPYESVEAAATYLEKLYDLFDDWLLAIAAYNAGQGKIGRALKGTGAKDFFTLVELNHKLSQKAQLRKETIDYVPRFLAVCKIMRNLSALGFEHVDMNQDPEHVRVEAKPGTDLKAMAKVVDMSWSEFKEVNSAHKQYVTHAGKTTYIYVPSHRESLAEAYIDKGKSHYAWKNFTVPKGATWNSISSSARVPVAALKAANNNKPLRHGSTIRIPNGPNVKEPRLTTYTASSKGGTYKIKSGETLLGIALKHNVSLDSLKEVNEIRDASKIRSGQVLVIPGSGSVASNTERKKSDSDDKKKSASASTAVATRTKSKTHKVKSGESLLGIALKYDVNTNKLMRANGIKDASKIRAGQVLTIPTGAVAASTPRTYKVKSGDTYWEIARKNNLTTNELLALNKKSKSSVLKIGETLLVSSR